MATNQRPVASAKSEITAAIPAACADEQLAVEFLEAQRWGGAPSCPHCGGTNVYQMKDRKTGERSGRYLWRCKTARPDTSICGKQYTVRVGTVYEDSKIPLRHWVYAFWAACASKKGVSALQIKRQTGLSYESALFMMHRIRFAMAEDYREQPKLSGTVEADETYVGGKPRFRNLSNRGNALRKKAAVFAVVQRDGEVRAWPMRRVNSANLQRALLDTVDINSSRLMTDEHLAYPAIGARMAKGHERVNHSSKEYVRGDAHTNTIEGFFSILKRGLNGTFHSVSKKHLHRYVSEFEFRYNSRKLEDGHRVQLAIRKAEGKRLFYSAPVKKLA